MAGTGGRRNNAKAKTVAPEVIERERRALEMRRDGMTYRQIAVEMGVDAAVIHRIVKRALARTLREPADQVRQMESERLDILWALVMQHAKEGNLAAVDRGVKVIELRAKLFGLQLPTQGVSPELAAGLGLVGQLAAALGLAPSDDQPADDDDESDELADDGNT